MDEDGNFVSSNDRKGVPKRKKRQPQDHSQKINYNSVNWLRNNEILKMKSIFET